MELNSGILILVASSLLVVTLAIIIIWLRKKTKAPKEPQAIIATTPLKDGLSKTRLGVWDKIASLLSQGSEDVHWDAIEEVLYSADLSVAMSQEILELLKKAKKTPEFKWQIFLKNYFLERLSPLYEKQQAQLSFLESPRSASGAPRILMITGVNGVGKTTTIGKLAHYLSDKKNRKIVLAAGDTFRAAAKEQLQVWAERSKAEIVSGKEGGDPSAVAFDAMKVALEKGSDLLIFDTAGRLQNKTHLMDELAKIKRSLLKQAPNSQLQSWMVIDATAGQNGLKQAQEFHQVMDLGGLVITKCDGSSKGGIVLSVMDQWKLPVVFVGVGEQVEDLRPFVLEEYLDALFGDK